MTKRTLSASLRRGPRVTNYGYCWHNHFVTSEDVIEILDLAHELGITMFIAGGWGVDALVGRQTRAHADLDVSLLAGEAERLEERLAALGFELAVDWWPGRGAWRHPDDREVDVHPLESDPDGTFRLVTMEGTTYSMPPDSYVTGTIGDRSVQCLSVQKQLEYHQGYAPAAKDTHDINLLRGLTPGA